MGRNVEEHMILHGDSKDREFEDPLLASIANSPTQNGRPTSMVFKKANSVIPAHLIAEAISTMPGLDLRWSGPITPSEMLYVQQYIFAKYPQYYNGLIEGDEEEKINVCDICITEDSHGSPTDTKAKSPKIGSSSPSHSFGNFISIPEIQARNRALQYCGLTEEEYLVIYTPSYKDAMMMIGESYPFFRGNYYMTIIQEECDYIRKYVVSKESKVIVAPETWLNLRIKGSQLSQYFRKKCKHSPKGLFAYSPGSNGNRYSMHWISEAHRNSWHVLLDATSLEVGKDHLALTPHRPDFVLCTLESKHFQPSKITCLLVRRKSFDTIASP